MLSIASAPPVNSLVAKFFNTSITSVPLHVATSDCTVPEKPFNTDIYVLILIA